MELDPILALELDPSSWMKWTAEGMRQPLMTALTMGLAPMTVHIVKMQELSVPSEVTSHICHVIEEIMLYDHQNNSSLRMHCRRRATG